eukprot:49463-Eustigmatos_ZCMA.PRE.1
MDVQELQDCKVSVPLVADEHVEIAKKYGLLRPKDYSRSRTASSRLSLPTSSAFIIDIDKRIRLALHYLPAIGEVNLAVTSTHCNACCAQPHVWCM